jgi:2-polyprenyl-3-methyl-5-hydroxy-6-metoxy-1,4-benzoquinol methylase
LRILDVGCGKGDLLHYLKERRANVDLWGIDLTSNEESPGITIVQGDFFEGTMTNLFDVICGLAVIEHVDRPTLFAKKLAENVTPGGLVILMTVNNDSLIYRCARVLHAMGVSRPYNRLYSVHHLQHFTNQSLKVLMELNGFKVEQQFNHNYDPRAVDVPKPNRIMEVLYGAAIRLLFPISDVTGSGILQTIACRRSVG